MPARNPRSSAPARDFTGQRAEQLRNEHADEIREREREMAMVASSQEIDQVIDVDPGVEEEETPLGFEPVKADAEGRTLIEAMPVESRRRRGRGEAIEVGNLNDKVEVRFNDNYEGVTIGAENHFDFEAGRRYRVPRWVAVHCERQQMLV